MCVIQTSPYYRNEEAPAAYASTTIPRVYRGAVAIIWKRDTSLLKRWHLTGIPGLMHAITCRLYRVLTACLKPLETSDVQLTLAIYYAMVKRSILDGLPPFLDTNVLAMANPSSHDLNLKCAEP